MPGHARTPGRHHSLGGPLPRQQANTTTARPTTPKLWQNTDAGVVASLGITRGFPRLYPILGLVTVALLTLAPLALRPVRLACLIHAANVHSEPGSNPSRLVGPPCPEEQEFRSSTRGLRNVLTGRSSRPPGQAPAPSCCWLLDPSPSHLDLQPNGVETTQTAPRRLPSKVLFNPRTTIDRIVKERTGEVSKRSAGVTCR